MIDIATLEKEALNLNLRDRGRLASVLLKSLDEDEDVSHLSEHDVEKLWIDEALRRNREMDEDPSIGLPGDLVLSELRDLIK